MRGAAPQGEAGGNPHECVVRKAMDVTFQEFLISDDQNKIQPDRVCRLLGDSYWAKDRTRDRIEKSIANSLCFGIYTDGKQIGFARCVTDFATVYWLADVIVDPAYRGRGLGKELVNAVVGHERLKGCTGILSTLDAHGLYEQYGFLRDPDRFLRKHA